MLLQHLQHVQVRPLVSDRAFTPCATPRILYTCSVPDELDHQSALHALDLAHRWQVDVAVAILGDLLVGV